MAGIGTNSAMYQTMMRQPEDLEAVLANGWPDAQSAAELISGSNRVFVTGIGTSYHAALVGSWLLRAAGADSRAITSYDVATYPGNFRLSREDAVIVMAHTGVKSYSAAAMQRAVESGATVISVGSQTAEHPGSSLVLRTVPRETSAAYTSSHLTAMAVLAQISAALGEQQGCLETEEFRSGLESLPDHVRDALGRLTEIEPIARYAIDHLTYAIGAGPNEATALELVIKAREAAYGKVDGLAAEQFLHGPMVTVDAGDLAVVVHVGGQGQSRVAEIARALDQFGARLWIVGEEVSGLADSATFRMPRVPELISPLLAVIPMQMLAYAMATAKGLDPDTFRKNDPVYKTGFESLTL